MRALRTPIRWTAASLAAAALVAGAGTAAGATSSTPSPKTVPTSTTTAAPTTTTTTTKPTSTTIQGPAPQNSAVSGPSVSTNTAVNLSFSCAIPLLGTQTYTGSVSATVPATIDPGKKLTVTGYQTSIDLPGGLTQYFPTIHAPNPLTGKVTDEGVNATNVTPTSINAAATALSASVPYTAGQSAKLTSPAVSVGPFVAGHSGTIAITPGKFSFTGDFGSTIGTQTISCTPASPVPAVAKTTINGVPGQLGITTKSLPRATAGLGYSALLAAQGGTGPYSWAVTAGSLPAGLSLAPATGVISGITKRPGTYHFTVRVTDSSQPPQKAPAALTLVVGGAVRIPGVYQWGINGFPRNVGTFQAKVPTPVAMPVGTKFVQLASGNDFSIGRTSTGAVYAWGANAVGQLGDGTSTAGSVPSERRPLPVSLPAGVRVTGIAAGGFHCLAVTSTGAVYAWGYNGQGQLGNGGTTNSDVPVAVSLPGGTKAKAVAAGGDFSLALTAHGKVLAWGSNQTGQLGDGTRTERVDPVAVALPPRISYSQIAAGAANGMALGNNGAVYAWGYNANGQLGIGNTVTHFRPVRVKLPRRIRMKTITAGSVDGFALAKGETTLFAWGYNRHGQLGIGNHVQHLRPVVVKLPKGTRLMAIAGGQHAAMALTTAGTVLAWGDNYWGQLGGGRMHNWRSLPVTSRLPKGDRAIAIASGPLSNASGALVLKPKS